MELSTKKLNIFGNGARMRLIEKGINRNQEERIWQK